MDTNIIVMANNKGGCGKTNSVAALGDVFSRKMGKKVLLIDADPQGNLSRRFGYDIDSDTNTTFEVFLQSEYEAKKQGEKNDLYASLFFNPATLLKPRAKIKENKYDNLYIIPAKPELQSVYETFHNDPSYAGSIIRRFLFGLKAAGEFDYIIIDTSPSLSYVLGQFLIGSDYLMIPLPPTKDAVQGAERVLNAYNLAYDEKQDFSNKELHFLGFFFLSIASNSVAYREIKGEAEEFWTEDNFFQSKIAKTTAIENAGNQSAPVTAAYPNNPASHDYFLLAKEIEKRIQEIKKEEDV